MAKKLLFTACGCVTVVNAVNTIAVIDSDSLIDSFEVVGLIIDGQMFEINLTFVGLELFVEYLNETFKEEQDQLGFYEIKDGFIQFYNEDNYTTIEVMAIIGLQGKEYTGNDTDTQVFPEIDGKQLLSIAMSGQEYTADFWTQDKIIDPITEEITYLTTVTWNMEGMTFAGTIVLNWINA